MKNARKYITNINNIISCGIGTCGGVITQSSMLDTFTVTYPTIPETVCIYPTLDTNTLKSISAPEYNKRIVDYVNTLYIDNALSKQLLIDSASFDEPSCDLTCLLNPEFFAYKFLSGMRVVNVGKARGILEYRAFLSTSIPEESAWQTSATFLNLDQEGIYNIEVRDNYMGGELCKYTITISMPLLQSYEKMILSSKIVELKEISYDNLVSYRSGCVEITSPLLRNESVRLEYTSNVSSTDGGNACVHITCKPNNASSFANYSCLTNSVGNATINNSIQLNYGDIVCYNTTATNGSYGSSTEANLRIISVNGLGTTLPVLGNVFSSTVTRCSAPLTTVISFGDNVTGKTTTSCTINGKVKFSNPIPPNESVVVGLLGANSTVGGSSSTLISCKTSIQPTYVPYCTINNTCSQPQYPQITIKSGDSICYDMVLNGPTSASGQLCIDSIISSTIGISPIKDSTIGGSSISASISVAQTPIVVAICRTNQPTINESTGNINLDIPLLATQSYSIDFLVQQSPSANTKIYCRPNGAGTYLLKCEYITNSITYNNVAGSITLGYGDCLCYTNSRYFTTSSYSTLWLCGVSSSADILPSICAAAGKASDALGAMP